MLHCPTASTVLGGLSQPAAETVREQWQGELMCIHMGTDV